MIGVTTVYLHEARVHGSKTCYRSRSQINGPRWLAKIIFFLKIISRKAQLSVRNIRKTNPVFSNRGSADCGPSRTGGSGSAQVYFTAKLGKHCPFREKGMDKDEVGKKRKKRSLACSLCFITESSAWVHPVNLRFLSSIGCLAKTPEKCRSVVLHLPCRSCYYTISEWRRLRFNDRTGTLLFRRISLPQLLKWFLVCL